MYIYIYVCVFIFYLYTYLFIYLFILYYIISLCVFACTYVLCILVYIYICVCALVYVYIYIYMVAEVWENWFGSIHFVVSRRPETPGIAVGFFPFLLYPFCRLKGRQFMTRHTALCSTVPMGAEKYHMAPNKVRR